jgi:serine protease Do
MRLAFPPRRATAPRVESESHFSCDDGARAGSNKGTMLVRLLRRAAVVVLVAVLASLSVGCGRVLAPSPEALRARTVVVHVHPSHRVAELFEAVADRFQQSGQAQTADFLRGHVTDSFGSGFIVRHEGAMYAVTNRHVVDLAEEPEIEIEGGVRLAADVVYTHPVYDLAILAPRGGPWPQGMHALQLASMRARDLDEVIATGHPGLNGTPSYQSTKGSVTNASLEVGKVAYIQHSAPIDPGSSGGPLINDAGFVIGVNAGKFSDRDNVYLAVPAPAVKEALHHAGLLVRARQYPGWETVALQATCKQLAQQLSGEDVSPDVVFSIGSDLIAERGFESLRFLDVDPNNSAEDRQELREAFVREPVAMLRVAVAVRLWSEAHEYDGAPVGCAGGDGAMQSQTAKLNIQFSKRSRESMWRFEQGQWRLATIGGFHPVNAPAPPNRAVAEKSGAKPSEKPKPTDKPTEKAAKKEERQHKGQREVPRK